MKTTKQNSKETLSTFEHQMFGTLRVVITDEGKTLFNLADVCRALDIKNAARTKQRLNERGITTMNTPTHNQFGATVLVAMTYIDEANLYRCIFQSRKAEAERFQDWVFEEVLPQIRQTGGYIPTRDPRTGERLTDEEIISRADAIVGRTLAMINADAEDTLTATQVAKMFNMLTVDFNAVLEDMGTPGRGPPARVRYSSGGRGGIVCPCPPAPR